MTAVGARVLARPDAGDRPGRESPDERILLWHRGLSILDIAVAHLIMERAVAADTGTMLRYH